MKSVAQHLLSLAIFLAIAFTATAVFAQEDTASTSEDQTTGQNGEAVRANIEARRAEVQENVAERREQVQENVAERRAALAQRVQERVTNLAANLSNRLDAITARLENIITRIDSRIEKLKEFGIDTNAAEAELENAKAAVDAAKTELSNIDTLVNNAVTSEDPRTDWAEVKMVYLTVREHVRDAHESLRTTIALLKTAVASNDDTQGVSEVVRNNDTSTTTEETE